MAAARRCWGWAWLDAASGVSAYQKHKVIRGGTGGALCCAAGDLAGVGAFLAAPAETLSEEPTSCCLQQSHLVHLFKAGLAAGKLRYAHGTAASQQVQRPPASAAW